MHTVEEHRSPLRGGSSSRAATLMALFPLPLMALIGVVMVVAQVPLLVVAVLVVATCASWAFAVRGVARAAEDSVLKGLAVSEATTDEAARLHNVVEGLCLSMGMTKPRLWTLALEEPVALAASQPHSVGSIVVSTGFVGTMDRMETEAVVAHLLVRLRSGDAQARTFFLAASRFLARFGLARLGSRVLASSLMSEPVNLVDLAACRVTRYPPGLMSALDKMSSTEDVAVASPRLRQVLEHARGLLALEPGAGDVSGADTVPSLDGVRLSASERIELLKEM